jgi:hypothetical protein
MSATAPVRRPGIVQWAGLGAIAYVILFIVGGILTFGGQPDTESAPPKIIAYYSDAGHRDKIVWGWVLILLGVFFFLWFLSALRELMRRIEPGGFLTNVATIGGVVYAALTLAGSSVNTGIKTMSDDTFRHTVYPELIHAADDTGYVLHSAGGVGAGALIIAASLALARAGLVPRWAGPIGIVVGVLALGSIFYFPQFLIALWLLFAGWLVYRAAAPVEPLPPAGPVVP